MTFEKVKYTDYNGKEREDTFYFHLSEAELLEMEMSEKGGLANKIKEITDTEDGPAIIKMFKELVLKSYGVKSEDGKRFIKSDEIATAFTQTPAYSKIFMKLATDADAAAKFVNGIVPAEMAKAAAKEMAALPGASN